jgi:hypothetical protein
MAANVRMEKVIKQAVKIHDKYLMYKKLINENLENRRGKSGYEWELLNLEYEVLKSKKDCAFEIYSEICYEFSIWTECNAITDPDLFYPVPVN